MNHEDMLIEELGPLPEPELSHYSEKFIAIHRRNQAEIARLKTESQAWRSKYEQVYNEQMTTKSTENHLREKLNEATRENTHLRAKVEAQRELIFELFEKRNVTK